MADQVFKYPLEGLGENTIDIEGGGRPLHVAEQDGDWYVWVLVDPDARTQKRRFFVHGTGHPLHDDASHHIGTFHTRSGFVFHVFTAV